jgi:hypothetical protein
MPEPITAIFKVALSVRARGEAGWVNPTPKYGEVASPDQVASKVIGGDPFVLQRRILSTIEGKREKV